MGSRISEKPERLFEVFLEIGKPEGSNEDPFVIQKFPSDYDDKETLAMIPKFAYPCETDASNVDHFTFVLTDIDGMFRFGYCRHATGHQTCLCLLSQLTWCEVFFKMLDLLAEITNRSEQNNVNDFLQATYIHEIPLPKIPVTIVANEDMFSFTSPDPSILPSIPSSRNLTEYYNAVDPANMMRVFAAMLQERRIYFTSKKLSRLTACIHAAEALLYPMHWQHLYIPILPSHLIDYISAPMPYIIGVHSNLVEKLRINRVDVADAVVVDLDANTLSSEYDDLECMPEEVSNYLKKNLKSDIVKNSMLKDGDAISRAFLQALVRLIGGYRSGLKIKTGEPITFDPEMFVHSRSSQTMQNYLEGMLALQIFQQFIYGRLEILNSGGGFVDMFEQQATFYTDKLNSQSSYKEWVKNVKKGGRKGKEMLNGLKVKVKVHGKKAVADIKTKISNLTEDDKRDSFNARGGIVHSRHSKHSSIAITEGSNRPSRPPLPANRKESGGSRITSADSQDDSHLRLSYNKVDMSLMADEDIQAAMMRSASAEALPKYLQESSSSSSSLSTGSVDDTDGANIPFGNLPSSDEETPSSLPFSVNLPPKAAEDQPHTGDRLILARTRPTSQATGQRPSGMLIISQPPVAPPRARRKNPLESQEPPQAQPPSSLIMLGDSKGETTNSSATTQEAPLIRFESGESESSESDFFDPLGKLKSSPQPQQRASADLDLIVADNDGQDIQMRKLDRSDSSRSSLSRSQAFRRESQKGPIRQSHVGNALNDSDNDDYNIVTSPKVREAVIFDPLSDNVLARQRSRTSSDLMKSEWSLASLAPSPRVYLPTSTNQSRSFGTAPYVYSTRNMFEQPGLIRQSTLPANPFPSALTSAENPARGILRSQASIPSSMAGVPMARGHHNQTLPTAVASAQTMPNPSPVSRPNVGSSVPKSGPQRPPAVSMHTPPLSSNQRMAHSSYATPSSSAFGQKPMKPVQSPFFNRQGGSPVHTQRNTVGPSSFAASSSLPPRASYAAAPASTSSVAKDSTPSKQADPFGDLVNLGFGNAEKKSPQQTRQKAATTISSERPPRPPAPRWETFD